MPSRRTRWLLCLALALSPFAALAQEPGTIRGVVTDAGSGARVSDVQIAIEGTRFGALSRPNGEYVIAGVPAGTHIVVARRAGYGAERRQVAVAAGQSATQDFTLRQVAITLNEVVVSGVGAPAERRVLGNTIESVPGEAVSGAPGVTAIDQALQGKIAGALISENSGQPGGGVSIRLRGTNSILGGAEPLYVVDGVIVDNSSEALVSLGANATRGGAALSNRLADLDPADVERVEVLKGAAAAALYGSRANNGVVQIFTKRGRAGDSRITFSTEYSVGETPETLELNMAPTASIADEAATVAPSVGAPVQRFDIQDQIFRTSHATTSRLSVSGGSGTTAYYLGGSYQNEDGILRSSDYERINLRANLNQAISSQLDVAARANYVRSTANFVPEGEQTQGVLTSVVFTPTAFNPNFDSNLGRYPFNPVLGFNPLDVIDRFQAPETVTRFVGGAEATFHPIESLTLRYLAGIDDYRQESKYLQPPFSLNATFTGSIQNPVQFSRRFNNDLTATHVWAPTASVGLTTALGFRYTRDETEILRAAANDLAPGQDIVFGATQFATQSLTELRTVGGYVEERVSFNDRLYVTGGINLDASSAFGEDERLQFFPRVSVSYLLGEEPFWQQGIGRTLSSLRLRAAYGETGGQPPGVYSRFDNFINTSFGGRPGFVASVTAGNDQLKPERQREFELGFDLGAFQDRAQLEFTYYDKKTTDLVLSVPLPPSRGFLQQFQNIGTLTNKGVEVSLNTINVSLPRFTWRTRLTYAANRNKIQRLVTASDTLLFDYLNVVVAGQPVGVFYGGVYARDANGQIAYDANGIARRGLDTVVVNGVTTTPFANRILGDPNPDFVATLGNTFELPGNVQLSVLFDGRFGNDVANFTRRITEFFGSDKALEREVSGDTASRTFGRNPNGRIQIYEEYIEDGSYVKLREVALQIVFDQPWVRRLRAQSLSVRVAGRNLYTWTDYRGLDPEINLFSANTVSRGVDFATTPLPRQFSVGLTFNY
ncbi:MAG: SusC/RagA family TonB-linked outer membrane protein [Gemmatimonadaceae bacterium]